MEKCSLPLGNKARYKIIFTKKDLKQDELLTFTYKTSNNFKIILNADKDSEIWKKPGNKPLNIKTSHSFSSVIAIPGILRQHS